MANDKRSMTPKFWLSKSSQKKARNPLEFLNEYKDFLLEGKLGDLTLSIFVQLEEGEILPTPALEAVRTIVFQYMLDSEKEALEAKHQAQLAKLENKLQTEKDLEWHALIFDAKGEVQSYLSSNGEMKPLDKDFSSASVADRWVDRRLFEGAPDWYAIISHKTIKSLHTKVTRGEAVSRVLATKPGAVMKAPSKASSQGDLGFRPKAKEDKAVFSGG